MIHAVGHASGSWKVGIRSEGLNFQHKRAAALQYRHKGRPHCLIVSLGEQGFGRVQDFD